MSTAVKKNKITYVQIAALAKVSPATVSRVARGNATVAPELRTRIRKAAAQLDVDLAEKRHERARTIAFVLSNRDMMSSFHLPILFGAEAYCTAQNWELLFTSFRYSSATTVTELHLPQIIEKPNTIRAVILGGTNYANMLMALRECSMPFSVLGNNVVGEWNPGEFDAIYSDDVQGARDVTTHLIAEGHRDIWFIGDTELPWYARCSQGYELAMHDAGYEPRFSKIHSDDRQLGYLAMRSILSNKERVSAVFAGSDQIAGGVYEALRQGNVSIPRDVSVVGFNDTDSKLLHPAATTVCEFPEELGKHLAEFVIRRINNLSLPPQHLTIPTQLVKRESVRPISESTSKMMDESRIREQGLAG